MENAKTTVVVVATRFGLDFPGI